MMRWISMRIVPGVLLGAASITVFAQAWPAKPVRLMVTQAAGSATDTVSRYYADKLGKAIGQQIVVENRPGKVTFAIDSHRNLNGIIAAYLNKVMGTDITLVPYTSTVQGMQDTAAGTTDAFIQTYGLMQGFVKKGDLRPIAVTSGARTSLQPDVATVAETYAGFQMTGWIAWFAPAATPVEILQRVNHELARIVNDPETRDWAERYFTPVDAGGAGTLAGLREFVRTEMAVWGKAIEMIGLKPE